MALTSRQQRLGRMLGLLAADKGIELTELRLEAYELGLSDIDMDTLAKAGMRALRECKFMPSVAELRALAGKKKQADTPHYFLPAKVEESRTPAERGWPSSAGEILAGLKGPQEGQGR